MCIRDRVTGLFDRIAKRAEQAFFIQQGVTAIVSGGAQVAREVTAPFMAFEDAIQNVDSILGPGADAMQLYGDGILSMVSTTRKGGGELAAGLYEVVGAIGQTDDVLKVLEINARGAAAGQMSVAQAVDFTTGVTLGYGDTSAEATQRVMELGQMAVNVGKTNFPELARSMGAVVPIAKALGVSQEEMFAVMGTNTGVTGKASEVATQLRGAMQALMAPTDGLSDRSLSPSVGAISACMAPRSCVATSEALPVTPVFVPITANISSCETPRALAIGTTAPIERASSGKFVLPTLTAIWPSSITRCVASAEVSP